MLYNGEIVFGKCHICKAHRIVNWCNICMHYFCNDCRGKWWKRGLGAIQEKFLQKVEPNCCGVIDA